MLITNCNNIKSAEVSLERNALNIKFAANGTGKSTISKAIKLSVLPDGDMRSLTPFGLAFDALEADELPSITGLDGVNSVSIFDDSYVDQFVFKQDEVLANSFQIFVKNSVYDKGHAEIDEALIGIKDAFSKDASIDKLLADLTKLIAGFGKETKKSSFSAASSIGRGIASGNKIENIPPNLAAYTDFLKSNDNVKWIKWQVSGAQFVDMSENCPFCTAPTHETKNSIKRVGEEFDAKTVEHLAAIIEILEELSSYFAPETNEILKKITTNKATLSDAERDYLGSIRLQAETLKNDVSALKNMNYFDLKNETKTADKILDLKIDLTFLDRLASAATKSIVDVLNSKLDEVADRAGELQGKIRNHQKHIATTIEANTSSINEFMVDAGYKYRVKITEDIVGNTFKMTLEHVDVEGDVIDGKHHLSYGERNAFALVLFMHEALTTQPDLVILDDPISSFDQTKKFAIAKRLFSSGNSLRDKTVLLLTHDFEPVIDAVYVKRDIFSNVKASHIANENGALVEKEITKEDILSFPQLCIAVLGSDAAPAIKAIYLRRYYEILDNRSDDYQILSSLIHGRERPNRLVGGQPPEELTEHEVAVATLKIKQLYPDFDYALTLLTIQSKPELIALYKASQSNYLKLQLYRILELPTKLNSTLMKHINETFHIENGYIMQIDPNKYQAVPSFIVDACDAEIAAYEIVEGI